MLLEDRQELTIQLEVSWGPARHSIPLQDAMVRLRLAMCAHRVRSVLPAASCSM